MRRLVVWVIVASALLLNGCTKPAMTAPIPAAPTPTSSGAVAAQVTENGFSLTSGRLRFEGTAGVAPAGATLTVAPAHGLPNRAPFDPAVPGFDIGTPNSRPCLARTWPR